MRVCVICLLLGYLLCGCRREDWKEMSAQLPVNVTVAEAQRVIQQLDRQTPPSVYYDAGQLQIRYNSMHIASRNVIVALEELANARQQEKRP